MVVNILEDLLHPLQPFFLLLVDDCIDFDGDVVDVIRVDDEDATNVL